MNTRDRLWAWSLLVLAALPVWASEADEDRLAIGDPAEKVIRLHGEPSGFVDTGSRHIYYYTRGTVTIVEGLITEIDLMTPEAYAAEQARIEARRAAEEERLRQYHQARQAQGEAIMTRQLNDPLFRRSPAYDQVRWWRHFRQEYPQVDSDEAYLEALELYEAEQQALAQEMRLRDLEARVAQAEARAARAEEEARRAQRRTSSSYYLPYPVFGHRPAVVIKPGPTTQPPSASPGVREPRDRTGATVSTKTPRLRNPRIPPATRPTQPPPSSKPPLRERVLEQIEQVRARQQAIIESQRKHTTPPRRPPANRP